MPPKVNINDCSHCNECLDACPVKAINAGGWQDDTWEVEADACIDCGECVEACPNGALEMEVS